METIKRKKKNRKRKLEDEARKNGCICIGDFGDDPNCLYHNCGCTILKMCFIHTKESEKNTINSKK